MPKNPFGGRSDEEVIRVTGDVISTLTKRLIYPGKDLQGARFTNSRRVL